MKPFSPLPPRMTAKLIKRLLPFGYFLNKRFKSLQDDLFQARIDIHPREYGASVLLNSILYAFIVFILFLLLGILLRVDLLFTGFLFAILFFAFIFFTMLFYPRIVARRRMRALEIHLIPALRHLLIEVRSGVPLFQALTSITTDYGEASREFREIVRNISTGMKEADALAESTKRNSSFQFRRAIWQISNALRAGSDLGTALGAIIDDLSKEQITAIRRYGQELNPWTMIYMIAAVIIPALGLTFLVIISSFSGAQIPKVIYPLIIFALFAFQIFFFNFVKTRRPNI